MDFNLNRKKLFSLYKDNIDDIPEDERLTDSDGNDYTIDDFLGIFDNSTRTNKIFKYLNKYFEIKDSDGNYATYDYFVKKYACDKDWAKNGNFCNTDFTEDGWDTCVNNIRGVKNSDGTITYDSTTAGGKVTLNKDHTFKSSITGWESGTWSCTNSGKILLDNTKVTPPGPNPSPAPGPNPSPTACQTTTATGADIISGTLIKKCVEGNIVKEIQKHLKKHGFPNFSKDGTIDGVYGGRTKKMVIEFQISKGLTPDGIVGPKTWVELVKDKSSSPVKPPVKIEPKPVKKDDEINYGSGEEENAAETKY
jgi:hypothetical protein